MNPDGISYIVPFGSVPELRVEYDCKQLWWDLTHEDDWGAFDRKEDLSLGFTMLRLLAEAGEPYEEIGPGVWRDSGEGVTWFPKQDL